MHEFKPFFQGENRISTPIIETGDLLFGHKVDDRDLRRREKANGRSPGPRPAADVQQGAVCQAVVTAMEGKKAARDQAEGKYLPPVGVTGELKVEGAGSILLYDRLVLEENGKAAAPAGEDFPIRQTSRRSETADSRVVDSCKIDHAADGRHFAAERNKP